MPEICVIENPTEEELAPLHQGLHDYNATALGQHVVERCRRLAVVARDEQGQVVGGGWGEAYWEWLHIDTLWVAPALRGQGWGRRLLTRLEQAVQDAGFYHVHLETTSFQALGFYQRQGYEIFGKLEGKPTGVSWYYLRRDLT